MDQYANHLKRLPFLSNWIQNQVFLPAEDQKWFQGHPHQSCVATSDHLKRAKTLQATGSRSPRAWYIVLFSLAAEVWNLTCPTVTVNRFWQWRSIASNDKPSHLRSSLLDAVRLCQEMLPSELRICGQPLDFGMGVSGHSRSPSIVHDHSWICLIALIAEGVKLTAHKSFVFEAYVQHIVKSAQGGIYRHENHPEASPCYQSQRQNVESCYAAADAILNIFLTCHESHFQYVHPYIAQSAWASATVQLLRGEMAENGFEQRVIRSKFEILKAISDRFVHPLGDVQSAQAES